MVNIIWGIIFLVGVMFGVFSGNGEQLSKSIIESTNSTVKLVIGLVGVMSLWCGIMKIAEESGLTDKIAKCIKPNFKSYI